MAESPVEFDQRKLFDQSNPLLNAVLTNIATFASDVSGGLGTLVEFLNLTKIYLQAIADPIALVLIPAIDQLIEAIEDLKNIGFGTLSVWPWEVGKVESGIDSTKALEAIQSLIVALNQINPDNLKWDPKTNQFQSVRVLGDRDELQQQGAGFLDSQPFGFSAFEQVSISTDEEGQTVEAKNLDKTFINNTLNTIYNYLNPKEWEEGDDATKRFINSLNESFQIRTLTPSQFVSEVNSSFDDTNDPARPIGSGDYIAFVGFFALPTHHALRDMINALLKFFANFLKNIPDLQDDKVTDIELGHPLVIAGLETDLLLETNDAMESADLEIVDVANEISDAQDAEDEAGVELLYGANAENIQKYKRILKKSRERYTNAFSEVVNYSTQINDLQQQLLTSPDTVSIEQEIARLSDLATKASKDVRSELIAQQEYGRSLVNATAEANNLQSNFNDKAEKVKQIQAKRNALEKKRNDISFDTTVLQEKFYTLDNTSMRDLSAITEEKIFTPKNNTHNGVTIPMFEEGTLIQQGHVFNDFTAEVVRHVEIRVKDGHVISNKLKVRKVRGNIKHNTSSPMQQINVPPIIALDGKQLDSFGILKTGRGIQGAKDSLNFPMFAPTNPDVPELQPALKFKATMETGSLILRTVLPVNDELIKYNSTGTAQDDPLTVTDIYTDQNLIGKLSFQVTMENFVENLTIGSPITHNFLVTSPVSDVNIPVNPFNRLGWSLFPGMGLTPCIKKVLIDGKELKKQDIKTQLFKTVQKSSSSKDVEYESMNEITIEIGRITKSGEIESYTTKDVIVPNKIVNNAFLDVPLTLHKTTGTRSSIPNWKFTRIQDIFPVYGKVLDRIIDKLEFAKDLASGSLDDIEKWIQYFEDLVRDLKLLNKEIQSLLQFLASGLDKQGLYFASFSGNDGVNGFKRKLSNAKIKNVNLEPIKEFSLEPVVVNRIGGDGETVQAEVLKLVPKENPESVGEQLISWSDLDSLKYSGGFVFYAQGNDTKLLEKFLLTSGLKKAEEKENPLPAVTTTDDDGVDFNVVNSLLEKVQPEVDKIEIEQTGFINDNVFIQAEGASLVRKDTQIKITFKNDSISLTNDEKQLIRDAKGNDFIFDVDINYGSLIATRTTNVDEGNVILSNDNFVTATPLNYSVQPVRETISVNDQEIEVVKSVIIKPQDKLEAKTNFKIKVKKSILNNSNQQLKDEFEMTLGFTTTSTTIIDIGLL